MSRIHLPSRDEWTEEQARICEAILASRGNLSGPFRVWLHSPEMADRAQALGEFVRYHTVLGPRLSELAILVTARFWNCQMEWSLHEPFAHQGGLDDAVIDAVRTRATPEFRNPDERAVYDFSNELLRTGSIRDEVYQAAVDHVGDRGTVELTSLVGYYTMVAMTLNAFQVPLPEGVSPLLPGGATFR